MVPVLSEQELSNLELEVLSFSGLPKEWIWSTDVKIDKISPSDSGKSKKQESKMALRTVIISDRNPARLAYERHHSDEVGA